MIDSLGRYSHRIALSDSRLSDFDEESVDMRYHDDRDGNRRKVMTLTGEELIRRFLLHGGPWGPCGCANSACWRTAAGRAAGR